MIDEKAMIKRYAIARMNATIDALGIEGAIWGTESWRATADNDGWTCFLSGIHNGKPFRYECAPVPNESWAIVDCAVRAEWELDP